MRFFWQKKPCEHLAWSEEEVKFSVRPMTEDYRIRMTYTLTTSCLGCGLKTISDPYNLKAEDNTEPWARDLNYWN